jgi:hypothetical protein
MKKNYRNIWLVSMWLLLVSCRSEVGQPGELMETRGPTQTSEILGSSTNDRSDLGGVIQQWAVTAEASSEFSIPEWSAEKALGPPDSPGCGDYQFAWASAASDSVETLRLDFSTAVIPLEIVIYESFNPDQVVKVEVYDQETGGFYTVLQKNPVRVDRPCPFRLVIPIEGIEFSTDQIRITVDQSQLGLGWNEIDAVQLIGSVNQP